MDRNQAAQLLDNMLPPSLRVKAAGNAPSAVAETPAESPVVESSHLNTEENPMSGQVDPKVLTAEQLTQIKSVASEAAAELLKQQDSQVKVAAAIEKHMTTAQQAKAEASDALAKLTNTEKALAELQSQVQSKTADLQAKTQELTQSAKLLEQAQASNQDLQTKLQKAQAETQTLNGQLQALATAKTVADRTQAIAAAGVKVESFTKRATATNENGTLKMSDADFTASLEELKAVATPKEPAPAATAAAPATTSATASVAPAAPDLSSADMYARAAAALVNTSGPVATPTGTKKYAEAFKLS